MRSRKPLVIIMIGPPGSGKGTQSSKIGASLGIPKISTGDILRAVASEKTLFAESIRNTISSGGLVSDEILATLIKSRLASSDCENGFILDGYPRNTEQAIYLESLLSEAKYYIVVVEIDLPEDVLIKRVTGRFSCKLCGAIYNKYFRETKKKGVCDECGSLEFVYRSDDSEVVVTERLREYARQTLPVIDFYKSKKMLHKIDGNKTACDVYTDLMSIFSQLNESAGQ